MITRTLDHSRFFVRNPSFFSERHMSYLLCLFLKNVGGSANTDSKIAEDVQNSSTATLLTTINYVENEIIKWEDYVQKRERIQ